MILSSSIKNLLTRFDVETAIDMMSKAGFDGIDFSFGGKEYGNKYFSSETDGELFRAYFQKLRLLAEEKGVPFIQAHAPMPSSHIDPDRDKQVFENVVRSIRNASYLGVPKIVVHPVQHLTYCEEDVPEKLFELNMAFYNRLKPYCEEYNIQVALENMWQHIGKKISHSTCSRPQEFNRYLDELDRRWFIGCLDIGHAHLVSEDPAEFIEKMGADRLRCLHVHDVDGITDGHTLPYHGTVAWNKVMKALAKIGYRGELNYEAEGFLTSVPNEAYQAGLCYMAEMGRILIKKFEEYQA